MDSTVRLCANIKSKKHPEARCSYAATNGDFCSRHCKKPQRWSQTTANSTSASKVRPGRRSATNPSLTRPTRKQEDAAKQIQGFWRLRGNLYLRSLRGPTTFSLDMSHNTQDIYTYEPLSTIPPIYRFSYLDSKSHAWTFDIRFLLQSLQFSSELKNPYTQEPLLPHTLHKLENYIAWLKSRKFPIVYLETDDLTPEQAWNQKVLTLFLKYQTLGYAIQTSWFESLSIKQHIQFYQRLFLIWLTIATPEEKQKIIPNWMNLETPLFRWPLEYATSLDFKNMKWWRKQTYTIMESFATRAQDKNAQITGALYVLMALVQVSRPAAEGYPFLLLSD